MRRVQWMLATFVVAGSVACSSNQADHGEVTLDGSAPADTSTTPSSEAGGDSAEPTFDIGGESSSCTPRTCAAIGPKACGKTGDGCGGVLDCGDTCTTGEVCGGGGVENVCGTGVTCTPTTCAATGATCGPMGDGCGKIIDCGTCATGEKCSGTPSKCSAVGATCTDDPLCTKFPTCSAGATTTLTGKVYAPNGVEPLYNALVYVPHGAVAPFATTLTCDRCETSGTKKAFAQAVSAPDGTFTLKNIPAGTDIPLVIELGKWRRVTKVNVTACTANTAPAANTRLPKKQAEGDPLDNIPKIALATGTIDQLECVLRKIGLADDQFAKPDKTVAGGGPGRIHLYYGNGATMDGKTDQKTTDLIGNPTLLSSYDAVLLACEGSAATQTAANLANIKAYADAGGRVFATHYNYSWLNPASNWKAAAPWNIQDSLQPSTVTGTIDTVQPKGKAFAAWLTAVSALKTASPPTLDIAEARANVDLDMSAYPASARWITSTWKYSCGLFATCTANTTQHLTFNTPYGAPSASLCGRALFSAFHVNQSTTTGSSDKFPASCGTSMTLSAQEKVLEFMLFDLASCVSDTTTSPPTCIPKTCADYPSVSCGQASDGCGGLTASCGTCTVPGETCGGGGVPSKCGKGSCTPKTCAAVGAECGKIGDGCGGILDCGTCKSGTCGGGGDPNKCGGVF